MSVESDRKTRLILASHAELHGRIAELEKALALAHGQGNDSPHELLTNTLLYSPRDPKSNVNVNVTAAGASTSGRASGDHLHDSVDRPRPSKRRKSGKGKEHRIIREDGVGIDDEEEDSDLTDRELRPNSKTSVPAHPEDRLEASLGTLTITQNGEARFVGNAAASSHLTESEGGSNPHQVRFSVGAQPRSTGFAYAYQGAEVGLGDFPFAQSLTSPQQNLGLLQLWQKLPAWDDDPLQGFAGGGDPYSRGFGQQRQTVESRIAVGGMDMIKAYWENVDWMYNVVPVRPRLPELFDEPRLAADTFPVYWPVRESSLITIICRASTRRRNYHRRIN